MGRSRSDCSTIRATASSTCSGCCRRRSSGRPRRRSFPAARRARSKTNRSPTPSLPSTRFPPSASWTPRSLRRTLAPTRSASREIQTNGVAATEIADNSIDSGEIVDNSLFSIDLAADLVRGSELGTINRRSATSGVIAGNGTGNIGVQCLAGERVLAGGNDVSSATNIVIVASRNDGANGWRVFARNLAAGNQTVTVHAYCLEAS